MDKDTRHRKYQLTINNPGEAWTHEAIREALEKLNLAYYCMADEIGQKEQTPHTHIFFASDTSAIRFSAVKSLFLTAHIEPVQGTSEENRAYIQKSGKWQNDPKADTSVPGTFEEWGECPTEHPGERTDLAILYEYIKDGLSNYEIMERNPNYMLSLDKIERARQAVREEKYRKVFRKLEITYIWGPTGTGKTRGVMEGTGGYEDVFI